MMLDLATLFEVAEATWPPAARAALGPVTLREGQGGGKRVSAATVEGPFGTPDLERAEAAMRARGQVPLFQVRKGEAALDAALAARGYRIVDPVDILLAPVAALSAERLPRLSAFTVWEPLEIMREIWAEGGIGPERIAVMERVQGPKTGLFARQDDHPAGAGFVAIHACVAMVHALEVRARHRRAGVGRRMMVQAALWAEAQGATHLAVLCTQANAGALALYAAMGFCRAGTYQYRIKE
jgi:GNAT superfamily N-acetyltransferase